MSELKLSKRLMAVCDLVPVCDCVCDIGCDHGYVPLHLVTSQKAKRAIAMDVRPGPLQRAEDHIQKAGLSDRIMTRLSDGFEQLRPGEADCCVIAGMGGPLMIDLLEAGKERVISLSSLILSPHSRWREVRRYLEASGYVIRDERMVEEEGKYYLILVVDPQNPPSFAMTDEEAAYGPCLIRKKDPLLSDYLHRRRKTLGSILENLTGQTGERVEEAVSQAQKEAAEIDRVLWEFSLV